MSDTSGTISIVEEKWNEILEHVRDEHELSVASFTTWLVPLSVHHVEEDVVTISVPTERFGLDYITRRFALPIKVAIAEVTGRDYEVRFVIPAEAEAEQDGTYELIRDKWLDGLPHLDGTTAISGFAAKQSPSALADAA